MLFGCRLELSRRRSYDVGHDVWFSWFHLFTLHDLLLTPVDKVTHRPGAHRIQQYRDDPRGRGHPTERGHGCLKKLDCRMRLASLEHVEWFAKREVAHHVKSEIVQPLAN